MTPSVSTSGRKSRVVDLYGVAVSAGVVRGSVDPAAVDDPNPGAGQDADCVRVIVPALDCPSVDVGGPGAFVATVVGEHGHRLTESFVAGPTEMHGTVFSGCFGDRGQAGERGDRVGRVVGFAGIAPLGEHLGGVDLTRPWQRREDRGVRVLPEVGGHGSVEGL